MSSISMCSEKNRDRADKEQAFEEQQRRDEVSGTIEPLQILAEKQCIENRYVFKIKRFMSKAKDCGG